MEYLAIAHNNLGSGAYYLDLKRFIGTMESILATGTGESTDEAYIVISPHHEYNILNYLGLRSSGQTLLNDKGNDFDRLSAYDENDNKRDIYFNINKPFRSLSESLSKPKKTKKRKSKKD
jgi:hypothetical protein